LFYRQMPELIERGHVYVCLPPLYKLNQGRNEIYLKDEAALNAYLISNAVEDAELLYAPAAPAIRGIALEGLLKQYVDAQAQIDRLSHRIDRLVLAALLDVPRLPAEAFADPAALAAWTQKLTTRLGVDRLLGRPQYELRAVAEEGEQGGAIRIAKRHHGLASEQVLPASFFAGGEYTAIGEAARALDDLIQSGARVARGTRSQAVRNFHDAQAWLLEEAKRGRSVQRFKGLGEMNPAQLWETTVNPDTRRLLQVRVEDAVAADQIFSTLMGDVVEPRRHFIESNALRVSNLDV